MSADVVLLIVRVAIALALYVFLGSLLYLLWRDVSAASLRPQEPAIPEGRLQVIACGDAPMEIGQTFPLRRLTRLGRSTSCTVVLPDSFASLEHAHIVLRDDRWWLEDRDSRNGTQVNHMPVTEPIVLSTGDAITIGSITLRVELFESPGPRSEP
jgi:FHA domain